MSTSALSTPAGTPTSRSGAFVTTEWTAVLAAGKSDSGDTGKALESLCMSYWPPLYAYVRRAGFAPADAQDLTQAFFERLLARNLVGKADPTRGRFRSFLLASLKNFLAHEWEKARAEKRGGGHAVLPLEFDTAETRCGAGQPAIETPDRAYDRQWALSVLEEVLNRLKREYADCGREALFLGLREALMGGRSEIRYRDLGLRCGLSEGAVKVAAYRMRARYRELLREEVGRTVDGEADVEDELQQLLGALSS